MIKDRILSSLSSQKIRMAQIDPFSYCNAGCWFCPVRYTPNPTEARKHMPIELFEKIIANMVEEKNRSDGIVDPRFDFIYTAHYNEILLYKHFKEMVSILRKYKIRTFVLSNGIPLTPDKTDIIRENADTIVGVCLNTPAFDRDTWGKRSGMNPNLFDKLISNIKYAEENLKVFTTNGKKQLSIQINGVNNNSFYDSGGALEKGKNFPIDIDLDPVNGELKKQYDLCKEMFPTLNVYPVNALIDRAGLLSDLDIISNKKTIDSKIKKSETEVVVGCNHSHEVGGRPFGWLHVNALGKAFLCCNDYNFDYTFGSFETSTLRDFWISDEHVGVIEKSYKEICKNCSSAKWGPPT
jgi:hypothetical protein